jgi:hypothetical protein
MRKSSADYLEEAKIEDLAADLERRGYRVAREAMLGDRRVDLLAERDGDRRAYSVKAQSRLKESVQEVEQLRQAALRAGLTGFTVVVAVPPRAVDVTIENLRSELLAYLVENDIAVTLVGPYPVRIIEDVVDVAIDAIDLHPSRVRIRGTAYLDVQVDDGGMARGEAGFAADSYPFSFDLDLDPNLKIVEMHDLSVDALVASTGASPT